MAKQFDDSIKQLEALSRQYWQGWQELAEKTFADAPTTSSTAPWQQGVDQWLRMFQPASVRSGAQGEMVERMTAAARQQAALMQDMLRAATGPDAKNPAAWVEAFRSAINVPGFDPALAGGPLEAALRKAGGQGIHDVEALLQSVQAMFPQIGEQLAGMLDMPTFGLMREQQEQRQQMVKALIDYQEQNARFNALVLKASERGFEKLESLLAEREQPGRQVETVHELYDLWVDAAEQAWEEVAMSAEFQEIYAALGDAAMKLRGHVQGEVGRLAGQLGMPTRAEVDTMAKRLHDLRRQVRGGNDTAQLQAQVDELRVQLEKLQQTHEQQVAAAQRSSATAAAAEPEEAVDKAASKGTATPAATKKAATTGKTAAKKAATKKTATKKAARKRAATKTAR